MRRYVIFNSLKLKLSYFNNLKKTNMNVTYKNEKIYKIFK